VLYDQIKLSQTIASLTGGASAWGGLPRDPECLRLTTPINRNRGRD